MQQLTVHQLADWLADTQRPQPVLLDVREPWEYELCHLPASQHLPMGSVPSRLQELDPDAAMVVLCHHGVRSMQVALYLERSGFSSVHNLAGGIHAWSEVIDPTLPRY